MANAKLPLDRRTLIAGAGAAALASALPAGALAQARPPLALKATAGRFPLGPDAIETPVWALSGPDRPPRRGERVEITVENGLPTPLALHCRGIDGASAAEPLLARTPLAANSREAFPLRLRHAGTFLCDPGLLGDGQARAFRGSPLIVPDSETAAADRDEVMLIEEWRLRADGSAIAPGVDPKDTTALYTLNGKASFELSASAHERLRLRFINASQRSVLAIKLEDHEARVMAIDGEPAEPFAARNGALLLAPGGRADALVDAARTASILLHDGRQAHAVGRLNVAREPLRPAPLPPAPPLPPNGLPARLELKNAQRFDVPLGPDDWIRPADFAAATLPAFRARSGRTVVLALTNRAATPAVFHLHGHHFRLLDRLDDGWKPFWLDTLAIDPGQTERIAFLAEHAGRYLIESVATDWAAPRLVRWYSVE